MSDCRRKQEPSTTSQSCRYNLKIVFLAVVFIWLHFCSLVAHWSGISFIGKITNSCLLLYTILKTSVPLQLIIVGQSEAIRKSQVDELTTPLVFTAIGAGLQKSLYI
jgi:hypothetical protein